MRAKLTYISQIEDSQGYYWQMIHWIPQPKQMSAYLFKRSMVEFAQAMCDGGLKHVRLDFYKDAWESSYHPRLTPPPIEDKPGFFRRLFQ